ncbi:MAG: precorrin-6Y C5,15-methyltransferase [Rhodospirillales bacterium RIFCSPLOWO2_12_FULL_58_28]|nr:MAG: precorrin-6Y C5,15-methyltransferase [Rhodospirillales bacterium RIFCSPLOWO2_02_FULL_58_16]OHC78569.1 MAG: precorrin-6Y C5,15-methyltransferase [Rhodospirillales bacterium RIFCSPLOWO2_12_FULL_58_28]
MIPWLFVIGLGEDGLEALSPAARALIDSAEVLVGGERHLAKIPAGKAERISWQDGFAAALDKIEDRRGRRVVVPASGDPFCYGIGAALTRRFKIEEMIVMPAPSAFSLAAARLGWSLPDVKTLTLHGRPLSGLNLFIAPNFKLLILSRDGATPAEVAALLVEHGYGDSLISVLEHMGGAAERRLEGTAADWKHDRCADLNVIAVRCRAAADARVLSRAPGLPDDAFEHDGKITKREVRAITLARLMPLPHQTLWDVGAGSGSVAIEWMRAERTAKAVAIERHADSCARIARNAVNLGTPGLKVVEGRAPEALDDLGPPPDAVFIGGGLVAEEGILKVCLDKLNPGGRLAANAVTMEAEERLSAFRNEYGGEMSRISIERAESLGRFSGYRPLMTVTQFTVTKR